MGRRCGVLGDPIEHSLSPVLHRAGYDALGLDWSYAAHRVAAGGLPDFLGALEQLDGADEVDQKWRGLSLTMPLKREAIGLVDDLSERARLAGAANTIVFEEGRLLGDNTDIPGAIAAIRERTTAPLSAAVIIGGGATATSIGLALADLGVRDLEMVVRSPERAHASAEALREHPGRPDVRITRLDAAIVFDVDLVASTIPAEAQEPHLIRACGQAPTIFEIIYHPWPTPLAASVGDRVLVSGFDLLLHQAACQFQLFTGEPAPLDAMRIAGEGALATRATG